MTKQAINNYRPKKCCWKKGVSPEANREGKGYRQIQKRKLRNVNKEVRRVKNNGHMSGKRRK